MSKRLSLYLIFVLPFMIGCAAKTHEVITCYPPYGDIYWGKSPSELKKTGFVTPYSRSISRAEREYWCYQVKKEGYKDSDVICREKEGYRNLDFYLIPLKTTIISHPSGATIYWGPTREQLEETKRMTPQIITIKDGVKGASWKDWCYQVKKEGHLPSEVACLTQQSVDREVKFELKSVFRDGAVLSGTLSSAPTDSLPEEYTISESQFALTWEDYSSNELGFEIERKEGSKDKYRRRATVGQNVTTFTDTELRPGKTYYYRVRAYNKQGRSNPSNEIRVIISAH